MNDLADRLPIEFTAAREFLGGGGAAGERIRDHDWATTALGAPQGWPQPLKTLVGVLLAAKQPMFVAWGAQHLLLYNDSYVPMLANRHPAALGRPFLEVWAEARDDLAPLVDRVLAGEPVHMDDIELQLDRPGRAREAHFAFSYTPVRDEGGAVVGFFCPCTETTDQVFAERHRMAEADRQRLLLQQMPGFVAVLQGPNHVYDYVNDAYRELSGARELIGRTVREAFPELADQGVFEVIDRVYATGEPYFARAMPVNLARPDGDRFIDLRFQPIRDAVGVLTGIFIGGYDVTERVRAERRHEALLRLEGRLADTPDTADMSFAAAAMLGRFLGASRVGYGTLDAEAGTITVDRHWSVPGLGSVAGVHHFSDFGAYFDQLRHGEAVVNVDVTADPRTADKTESFRAIGVKAFLDVPVVEQGKAVAEVFVHSATARVWTAGEIAFVRDFAERTRAAIARRLAEGALRASEARLRAVIEAAPVGLIFGDADGRVTGGNARVEEMVGHPVLPSATVDEYREWMSFHPDGRRVEGREYPLARVLAGTEERPELEVLYRRGDGRDAWVRFVAAPVRDEAGRIVGGVVASLDIDRERRSEARLLELNATRTAERDQMWEMSPDLMLVIDFQGVFRRVNPAWTSILGYAANELVGHHVNEFVIPDDHRETTQAYEDAAAGVRPTIENRYRHKDGSVRWISWLAAPAQEMTYAVGRDVTLERKGVAELVEAQEQLRQAQKMEAVGQLTGGIAHDFNNLLTGVIGSLELMQRRINRGETDKIQRYATMAVTSANRAAALTHRLLAFSRRQPLDPKPVSANRLVTGMEELLRRTIGEAIAFEIVTAGGLWQTRCDPHQLESAILNLAINARDAMPDGGKLTIETCNVHLDSAYAAKQFEVKPGQYVCICVTDTGTGMAKETIERAFEPFFTTKPIGQGTGLGLSMIYGFTRQSEGYARIYSEVGQGTTVKLYLPRDYGESEEADESQGGLTEAHRAEAGEVVLVVEDETTVRDLVVDVLKELGYRAVEAADGPAGLKILQSGMRLDLLVTDIGLPGLNGRQVADAGRLQRPDLKVLFMTGYAENATIANGFLDPGMEMITKPFAIDALATRIRDMIERG